MEQTTRPNYTPLYENGQRVQIRGMAATSIRNQFYQVSLCETCKVKVAWAKSSKTGKWYVCETAEYTTPEAGRERFRAVPYSFHNCANRAARETERQQAQTEWEAAQPGDPLAAELADRKNNPEKYAKIDAFVAALNRQARDESTPEDDALIADVTANGFMPKAEMEPA